MLIENSKSDSQRYTIGETVKITHLAKIGEVVSYDPSSSTYSVKMAEGNTIQCSASVLEKRQKLFG